MAINGTILAEALAGQTAAKITSSLYTYPIKYATIYNPLLRIKSDAVYLVVNPKEFPSDADPETKGTLVVLGGLPASVLQQTPHDVICMDSSCCLGKVYEQILELIDTYSRWHEQMEQILLQNGSAEQLCQTAAPFLDNPLLLACGDFHVLAVCQSKSHPFARKIRDEKGCLCEQRMVSLLSDQNGDSEGEGVHFHRISSGGESTLRMTIEDRQQVLGYVCVDDTARPFTRADYTRLSMMQPFLRRYLQMYPDFQNAVLHQIKQMLSETLFTQRWNPGALEQVFAQAGWEMDDAYCCCVMQPQKKRSPYVASFLCGYLEHHAPGIVTVRKNEKILLVCNWDRMQQEPAAWQSFLEQLCRDYGLAAGISTTFSDAAMVPSYLRQAQAVLTFCARQKSQCGVYPFGAHRLSYILMCGLGSLPLEVLMTPELLAFLQEDAKGGFENYKILRSYLYNNLSISETTSELFLHRSSLVYRLDKIKKMLGTDLAQRDEQLYYRIMCCGIDAAYQELFEADSPPPRISASRRVTRQTWAKAEGY